MSTNFAGTKQTGASTTKSRNATNGMMPSSFRTTTQLVTREHAGKSFVEPSMRKSTLQQPAAMLPPSKINRKSTTKFKPVTSSRNQTLYSVLYKNRQKTLGGNYLKGVDTSLGRPRATDSRKTML